MFWSHDLLGKKTALGAVWIAAHGKKLNKGRILQVNVSEACKKVMDPEVPQALRLQAILVGGIVIVHARQQVYLLEDAQETLRRLRSLDTGIGAEGGQAGRATLAEGKTAAREEAITLPLNADLQLLNLGDLFPSFATQALSEGGASGSRQREPSEGGGPPASARAAGKSKKAKGRRDAAAAANNSGQDGAAGKGLLLGGIQGGDAGADVDVTLTGLPRHDLELMDGPETFAVPDIDLLVPGMEDFFNMGAPPAGAAGAAAEGGEEVPPMDELRPVPEGLDGKLDPHQQQQRTSSKATTSTGPSNVSKGSKGSDAAAPPARKGRKGAGKKRMKPTVDDINTLQIRGRDYRDWMNDRSDLLVPRPRRTAAPQAPATVSFPAVANTLKSALVVGPATAAGTPGGAWPADLAQLFARHATLPKAESQAKTRKAKKAGTAAAAGDGPAAMQEADPLQEQEQYLDELAAAGAGAEAPLLPMDGYGEDGFAFGAGGMYGGGLDGLGGLQGEDEAGPDPLRGDANPFKRIAAEAARGYRSEASDEEELDVETERLRAALNSTQGSDPYFLQQLGLTPASADPAQPGSAAATGRGRRGTKRGSELLRRDSESGVLSEKSSERRGGSRLSDLMEGGGLAGAGEDLGAMLPAVGEEEEYLEGGSSKRQRTDEPVKLTDGTSLSQFQLLEASAPTQALPGAGALPPGGDSVNRQTRAFLGVIKGRFEAAKSALAAGHGDGDAAPACQLSLFELAARLSRMDAAKLFYQTLQARTHGFLSTYQEEPYGDILLTRGAGL